MADPDFASARSARGQARELATTVMCAEAQWWRCHRRLIADALTVRGRPASLGWSEPVEHELTSFAVRGPGFRAPTRPPQGELWA